MNKPLKAIPEFANEAEELAFWETHDSTDYLDWTKAQQVVLPNLIHPAEIDLLRQNLHPPEFIKKL